MSTSSNLSSYFNQKHPACISPWPSAAPQFYPILKSVPSNLFTDDNSQFVVALTVCIIVISNITDFALMEGECLSIWKGGESIHRKKQSWLKNAGLVWDGISTLVSDTGAAFDWCLCVYVTGKFPANNTLFLQQQVSRRGQFCNTSGRIAEPRRIGRWWNRYSRFNQSWSGGARN